MHRDRSGAGGGARRRGGPTSSPSSEAAMRRIRVAYRGGRRYVPRLRQLRRARGPAARGVRRVGDRETRFARDLALQPASRRAPGPGEVEVRVALPGSISATCSTRWACTKVPAGPLGSEFVGTVVTCGDGVAAASGQRVFGMAAGAFQSYVCVDAATVAPLPSQFRLEESATLPIVFLTALHALESLARLQRGERVLIHAARRRRRPGRDSGRAADRAPRCSRPPAATPSAPTCGRSASPRLQLAHARFRRPDSRRHRRRRRRRRAQLADGDFIASQRVGAARRADASSRSARRASGRRSRWPRARPDVALFPALSR